MANTAKVGSISFDNYVKTVGRSVGQAAAVEAKTETQAGHDKDKTVLAALKGARSLSAKIAKDPDRKNAGINRALCDFYDIQRNTARETRYADYDEELRLHNLSIPEVVEEFVSGNTNVLRGEQVFNLANTTKKVASEARSNAQSAVDSDESPVIHFHEDAKQQTLTTYTRYTPAPLASKKEYGASGRNRVNTYVDLYTMCGFFLDPKRDTDEVDFLLEQLNPALTSKKSNKMLPVSDRMQVLMNRMREVKITKSTMPIATVLDGEGHRHVQNAYENLSDSQLKALGLSAKVEEVPLNQLHSDFLQEKKEKAQRVKLLTRNIKVLDIECGLEELHIVKANRYAKD
jgi:hypothetical protein